MLFQGRYGAMGRIGEALHRVVSDQSTSAQLSCAFRQTKWVEKLRYWRSKHALRLRPP
jgi:hypothetical protein